jgi:hypothetical protein
MNAIPIQKVPLESRPARFAGMFRFSQAKARATLLGEKDAEGRAKCEYHQRSSPHAPRRFFPAHIGSNFLLDVNSNLPTQKSHPF